MSCTGIIETSEITGGAEGGLGWFKLARAIATLDSGNHTGSQYAVTMDLVSEQNGGESRIAVELTPDSARKLVGILEKVLGRGIKDGLLNRELDA